MLDGTHLSSQVAIMLDGEVRWSEVEVVADSTVMWCNDRVNEKINLLGSKVWEQHLFIDRTMHSWQHAHVRGMYFVAPDNIQISDSILISLTR